MQIADLHVFTFLVSCKNAQINAAIWCSFRDIALENTRSFFAGFCTFMHFEIPHLSVNFITSKIYMYAGVTQHPFYYLCRTTYQNEEVFVPSGYVLFSGGKEETFLQVCIVKATSGIIKIKKSIKMAQVPKR